MASTCCWRRVWKRLLFRLVACRLFFAPAAHARQARAKAWVNTLAVHQLSSRLYVTRPVSGPAPALLEPRATSARPRLGSECGRHDQVARPQRRSTAGGAVACPQRPHSHKNGPLLVLVGRLARHTSARCAGVNPKNRLALQLLTQVTQKQLHRSLIRYSYVSHCLSHVHY
jgi:hypothetical protein